ncbi:MAG: hypothetical protein KF734_03140 [Saprospiraceae bacterium]|nr:hypothetical protein [Saprospiraceae bacterium]
MQKILPLARLQTSPWCLSLFLLTISAVCCKHKPAPAESGVLEIGLICSDLSQSLDFYKNIVGMKEIGGFEVEGDFSADIGLSNGKAFNVRRLKLVNSPSATILKLACCSDSTAIRTTHASALPGMRYLTFEVASTQIIKENLQRSGIPLLGKTPIDMGDGTELLMCQDPDGVFVEIVGGK